MARSSRFLPLAAALATACGPSPGPAIELATVDRGAVAESLAQHEVQIDARGHVSIDGEYHPHAEVAEALKRLALSLPQDEWLTQFMGMKIAPEGPLRIRIDRSTRFRDAAEWMGVIALGEARFERLELAVRNSGSDATAQLPIRGYQYPICTCSGLSSSDSELEKGPAEIRMSLLARRGNLQARWRVIQPYPTEEFAESEWASWDETWEVVERRRDFKILLHVAGELPAETPWEDVARLLAVAIERGVEGARCRLETKWD